MKFLTKVSVDEAYSSEPWWYDVRGFLILTFAYRSTLPAQIRLFSGNIKPKHLEIAIGSGSLFDLILKYRKWKGLPNAEITGFDYAPRMLEGAKRRFSRFSNVHLCREDAAKLSFPDAAFDSANIANAIHCLPDIEGSLIETHRVLKPGGTLAGNCLLYPKGRTLLDRIANRINAWGTEKGILNRPYTADEIRELLKNTGFEMEYQKVSGNCFDFVARKV